LQQPFGASPAGREGTPTHGQPGGILNFEAAPARLQLAPHAAEPAAVCAYDGVIPGPLIRVRQGDELRLRLANRLLDPTTLSFPGLRAANSAAGIGGLTQERLNPVRAPKSASSPQMQASIFTYRTQA
jgi:FtsP/CotA-like multicopper oxidase with cupredoxin domain